MYLISLSSFGTFGTNHVINSILTGHFGPIAEILNAGFHNNRAKQQMCCSSDKDYIYTVKQCNCRCCVYNVSRSLRKLLSNKY